MIKERLQQIVADLVKIKFDSPQWQERLQRLSFILLLTSGSYLAASRVNSLIVVKLTNSAVSSLKVTRRNAVEKAKQRITIPSALNYRNLEKSVIDRNLFNSEGQVPDESVEVAGGAKSAGSKFDILGPCSDPKASLELFGTIYLGELGPSIAAIRDSAYIQADIYRTGDAIIGHEEIVIAKIGINSRNQPLVILNNGGVKECLELAALKELPDQEGSADEFVDDLLADEANSGPAAVSPRPAAEEGSSITLESTYVAEQIGKGGGNLITKGRLVPFSPDGEMKGFKLIGVVPTGLFGKIGLKNGDVVTQVNDVNLQQPDQGYTFYQVFENEREIVINLLRGGKTPVTVNVKVKD